MFAECTWTSLPLTHGIHRMSPTRGINHIVLIRESFQIFGLCVGPISGRNMLPELKSLQPMGLFSPTIRGLASGPIVWNLILRKLVLSHPLPHLELNINTSLALKDLGPMLEAEVLWENDEDLQEMQGGNSQENLVLLVTWERGQPVLTLPVILQSLWPISSRPVLVSAGIRQDSTQKGEELMYKSFLYSTVPGDNYI